MNCYLLFSVDILPSVWTSWRRCTEWTWGGYHWDIWLPRGKMIVTTFSPRYFCHKHYNGHWPLTIGVSSLVSWWISHMKGQLISPWAGPVDFLSLSIMDVCDLYLQTQSLSPVPGAEGDFSQAWQDLWEACQQREQELQQAREQLERYKKKSRSAHTQTTSTLQSVRTQTTSTLRSVETQTCSTGTIWAQNLYME